MLTLLTLASALASNWDASFVSAPIKSTLGPKLLYGGDYEKVRLDGCLVGVDGCLEADANIVTPVVDTATGIVWSYGSCRTTLDDTQAGKVVSTWFEFHSGHDASGFSTWPTTWPTSVRCARSFGPGHDHAYTIPLVDAPANARIDLPGRSDTLISLTTGVTVSREQLQWGSNTKTRYFNIPNGVYTGPAATATVAVTTVGGTQSYWGVVCVTKNDPNDYLGVGVNASLAVDGTAWCPVTKDGVDYYVPITVIP